MSCLSLSANSTASMIRRRRAPAFKDPAAAADGKGMRALLGAAAAALLMTSSAAAAAPAPGTWNRAEQRAVADAGVLPDLDDGAFHGERPLDGHQLQGALGALAARAGVAAVPAPVGRVTVAGFDRLLVEQLGLGDVVAAVQAQARGAGLDPPPRFGGEVVARLLGLRFDHPPADEREELYPWEPITRAEAAHSLARVLAFGGWEVQAARDALSRFVLPRYGARQRAVLRIAVARIGMPYVWGGTLDRPGGWQVRGGFDCSGLVWRVFKATGLARIGGRTAAQQAGEIRRAQRLRLTQVRPADLLFFGRGRFWQKATERRIVHEGIALSPDWMIHASDQGVYVSPLFDGWRRHEFSWARGVL
ncbi:MAG: peptidoglycan DL-endopeptidase CwlO [Solirubrobacteraceae bacterium]|nr:peptidoglycan DL-endopeptidase CwlO [Solirubrobacteraceae bacterium]